MKVATALLLFGALILTGCSITAGPQPSETRKETKNTMLTWQEAKAHAQAKELEIVHLIPEDKIISVDQTPTGILLSCNNTEHRWKGTTTVKLIAGTTVEPIVREIAAHYRSARFATSESRDVDDTLMVQMIAPDHVENYIIGTGANPDEFWIDSGSACFTLPEGTYPGGDF